MKLGRVTILFVVMLTSLAILCFWLTARADNKYPLPFSDEPDWQGVSTSAPPIGVRIMRAQVMSHALVWITLTTQKAIDNHRAAEIAYQNLFENVKRLPVPPIYVAVIVYAPNAYGVFSEYAFVFKLDSAKVSWKRFVSKKELIAIECALGRCPNYQS